MSSVLHADIYKCVIKRMMVRIVSATALLLIISIPVFAQPAQYERVTDSSLVYMMNRIRVLGEVKNLDEGISVRALDVSNPSGSGDTYSDVGSDVVSHDIYIAVSEFVEHPDQSLYRISDLTAPRLERIDREEVAFYLQVGTVKTRRTFKIAPRLSHLEVTRTDP